MLSNLHISNADKSKEGIARIQDAAINNRNMFEELMETCKYASLGQITNALFEVGGQYRRNM
jgi:methylmalonyl-CoA mutase